MCIYTSKCTGFAPWCKSLRQNFLDAENDLLPCFAVKRPTASFLFRKKTKFREKLPLNRGFLGLCGGGFGEVDKKQGWILVKSTKISKIPEWVEFFSEKQVASFFSRESEKKKQP